MLLRNRVVWSEGLFVRPQHRRLEARCVDRRSGLHCCVPLEEESQPDHLCLGGARILVRFHRDQRGEHATEVAMLLGFVVLPLIYAVYLLQDILREYVAFGQIFISSPFF